MTLIGGQLLAVLLLLVLELLLNDASLHAWGWRIPFVFGAASALLAMRLRQSLQETATAKGMADSSAGSLRPP